VVVAFPDLADVVHRLPDQPPELVTWRSWAMVALFVALLGAGVWAQVHRYRYVASPPERQQTKWVLFAIVIVVVVIGVGTFLINGLGWLRPGTADGLLALLVVRSLTQLALLTLPPAQLLRDPLPLAAAGRAADPLPARAADLHLVRHRRTSPGVRTHLAGANLGPCHPHHSYRNWKWWALRISILVAASRPASVTLHCPMTPPQPAGHPLCHG
jgi:hypothetical protein